MAVIALRTYAYISENLQITYDPASVFIPREQWDTFDPHIVADDLFAATNILRYRSNIFFYFKLPTIKIFY